MAEPFQFPSPIEDCDCIICLRKGVDMEKFQEPASVFETYQLCSFGQVNNVLVGAAIPTPPHEFEDFASKNPKIQEWLEDSDSSIRARPWWKVCSQLLKKLLKQKEVKLFKEPVDWVTLNYHDYPTYIKHPMDLGTIDRRLHGPTCLYTNPDDFVSDVRMVFRNAYVYNPEGNPVRACARLLSKMFEEDLLSFAP